MPALLVMDMPTMSDALILPYDCISLGGGLIMRLEPDATEIRLMKWSKRRFVLFARIRGPSTETICPRPATNCASVRSRLATRSGPAM